MVHRMTNFNPCRKAIKDDPSHLSLKDFNQIHVFRKIFFCAVNRGRQVTFELTCGLNQFIFRLATNDQCRWPKDFFAQP